MLVSSYIPPNAAKGRLSAIKGRGLVAIAPTAKDGIVAPAPAEYQRHGPSLVSRKLARRHRRGRDPGLHPGTHGQELVPHTT